MDRLCPPNGFNFSMKALQNESSIGKGPTFCRITRKIATPLAVWLGDLLLHGKSAANHWKTTIFAGILGSWVIKAQNLGRWTGELLMRPLLCDRGITSRDSPWMERNAGIFTAKNLNFRTHCLSHHALSAQILWLSLYRGLCQAAVNSFESFTGKYHTYRRKTCKFSSFLETPWIYAGHVQLFDLLASAFYVHLDRRLL